MPSSLYSARHPYSGGAMTTIYGLGIKGNRQHIVDYSRGAVEQGSIRWLLSYCGTRIHPYMTYQEARDEPPVCGVCAAARKED